MGTARLGSSIILSPLRILYFLKLKYFLGITYLVVQCTCTEGFIHIVHHTNFVIFDPLRTIVTADRSCKTVTYFAILQNIIKSRRNAAHVAAFVRTDTAEERVKNYFKFSIDNSKLAF